MFTHATAPAREVEEDSVAQLAKFFSGASPVRLPIQLTSHLGGEVLSENVVIEFGTPQEVLFACKHPLEFADRVRLRNADGSLDVEASVVAVHYYQGRMAVAARFTQKVTNWIVKP